MSFLDKLYGEGSSEAFREAIKLNSKYGTPYFLEKGYDNCVIVSCHWGPSLMEIKCETTNIHYISLKSFQPGLYTDLIETTKVPQWAKERGVLTFTTSPVDKKAEYILMKKGNWKKNSEGLVWKL